MSYVFIRVASPVLGPAVLMELRFAIGAGVGVATAAALGSLGSFLQNLRSRWRVYAIVGAFSAALPTTLIGLAELRITASIATILNATVPFFTMAVASRWLNEPLTARRVVGLVIGFLGVAVVVGGGSIGLDTVSLLAVAASLAAATSYGFGSVFIRLRLNAPGIVTQAFGFQVMAAGLLLPFAAATVHPVPVSGAVLGSILGLSLLSTALAYPLFLYLVREEGPTPATTVTFLSPVFGVLGGYLLLGEPLGPGLFVGSAMILFGAALVTRLQLR